MLCRNTIYCNSCGKCHWGTRRITLDDIVDFIREEAERDYQLASGTMRLKVT